MSAPISNSNNNNSGSSGYSDKSKKPIRDIPKHKRRSVISKKKFWERLKIRQMLKEGHSEMDIRAELNNMKEGTYKNRMNEIRMEDNEYIVDQIRNTDGSFLVTDIRRLEERFSDGIKHMDTIIKNEKASFFVQIEAQRLKSELALAILKLRVEGPRLVDEVSKPVKQLAEGKLTPLQALQSLPRVKEATEEERRNLKWVVQEAVEKGTVDSSAKKED